MYETDKAANCIDPVQNGSKMTTIRPIHCRIRTTARNITWHQKTHGFSTFPPPQYMYSLQHRLFVRLIADAITLYD